MDIKIGFVTYIAAMLILLLGIALTVLLIARKEYRSSKLYQSIVLFSASVMVYCGLYFYFYYRDMVPQSYGVNLPIRLFDYLVYGAIPLLWLRVIGIMDRQGSTPSDPQTSRIFILAWMLGVAQMLTGMICTCFMNNYYNFPSRQVGVTYVIAGSVITILIICVTGYYSMRFIQSSVRSLQRRYAGFVSIVLCLWLCCQQVVDSCLYLNKFVSAWAAGIPDSTAFAVFLMGLCTFLFVFREDFSPLFYDTAKAGKALPETNVEEVPAEGPVFDVLEQAAAQHGLTVRELDVLRLVYEGKNNPDIADALFISRNTVKKHLQNIYEKTGVNSRMELLYVVNLKKSE